METEDLFKHITGQFKWYAGKYSPAHASMLKTRFYNGTLSAKKIEEIFNKFGYVKQRFQEQWLKQENGK